MIDWELQDWGNDIELLRKEFEKRSPEDRAYAVIKFYFEFSASADEKENGHGEMHDKFLDWLLSSENKDAKDKAMMRFFDDICGEMCDEPDLSRVKIDFAMSN